VAGVVAAAAIIGSAYAVSTSTDETRNLISVAVSFGTICGWIVTPDIDHPTKHTHDEQRIWRINHFAGVLWSTYWQPYARFHGHRGRGSHKYVTGTVPRFLLLLWPLLALSWFYLGYEQNYVALAIFWLSVFFGQAFQDAVHITMDKAMDEANAWI
jgi:uncharacterized metal-binding protein